MLRIFGVVALLGAVGFAREEQSKEVDLLFPGNWKPNKHVTASIVDASKAKTTYALGCEDKEDDCSIYFPTMTQGPSTWIYGGEWKHVGGVDQYTLSNYCKINADDDEMTCTTAVTQVKDDKTLSTAMTSTTSGLTDYIYPIPLTKDHSEEHPKPTKTKESSKKATTTSEPTSTASCTKSKHKSSHSLAITTSELVFVVAAPSQLIEPSTTAEPSTSSSPSTPVPAVVTPSNSDNAAPAPAPTRNAMLVVVAAVMGGALML